MPGAIADGVRMLQPRILKTGTLLYATGHRHYTILTNNQSYSTLIGHV
jgi:hypothetical protein